jgi:succinate dehydrogenase/fumarate reductase iron-sulfur protein
MNVVLRVRDGQGYAELHGDFPESSTVLELLERFRGRAEDEGGPAVPAYRHSCHHGSCGSCGAIVNGLESLMCLTRVAELASARPRTPGGPAVAPELSDRGELVISLEPLRRAALIAGIAARPVQALAGIPRDAPYLFSVADGERAALPDDPTRREIPPARESGPARQAGQPAATFARLRFEACIECGLCSSSCPVRAPFIGPAALAAINREREKNRERAEAMLELAAAPDGAAACERHLFCSRVCPQAVYPGKHIQLLKNALAARAAGN